VLSILPTYLCLAGFLIMLGLAPAGSCPALPDAPSQRSAGCSATLPYGIAIAAGGIAIIIELAKL
jgi:Flp pilus assembly protein protease CpaA